MRFRPSILSTLVLFSLAAGFIALGQWQQGRAESKERIVTAFAQGERADTLPVQPDPQAFTRVKLSGRFDAGRQWLVDNQVHQARPGLHVLTPFEVNDDSGAGRTLLVNRGWVAQGPDRSRLPDVPSPPASATIEGFLAPVRTPGIQLGEGPGAAGDDVEWPRRVVWPDLDTMAQELGQPLYPLVLYLDANSPAGLDGRDWQPVSMGPERHRGYAVQWYALAATAIAGWLVLATRRRTN